jgi:hypothetical protein
MVTPQGVVPTALENGNLCRVSISAMTMKKPGRQMTAGQVGGW